MPKKKSKTPILDMMNAHAKEKFRKEKKEAFLKREFYRLQSILGYDWAIFYFLIGSRQAGKSYATTDFFLRQWRKYGRPFYWLRLTENSAKKLLQNNAEKLIDPDLRRKYNLDLMTNGTNVYEVLKRDDKGKIKEKKLMARVLALNTFYSDKGSGYFDKDFLDNPKMYYNICLDEMNREKDEKKSFDIVYSFTNQLENLVRNTKTRIRIICIGNTLEEASDILSTFNFLPEKFGRFKLKKKRAIIEYMEPTEKYLNMRKGSIADILMPEASTFSNKIETDYSLVNKSRLIKPQTIIKFTKSRSDWFTVWNNSIIAPYNGEKINNIVNMRPYLDGFYSQDVMNTYITLFDTRSFQYKNLVTFKLFQKNIELLKPRKNG